MTEPSRGVYSSETVGNPWTANDGGDVPKQSIGAVLEREIGAGKEVAIAIDGKLDGELWAVRADRAKKMRLDEGPVDWVAVDTRSHVIWFGKPVSSRQEQLCLLDLEGSKIESLTVGIVPNSNDKVYLTDIRYPERRLRTQRPGAINKIFETEGWEVVLDLNAVDPYFELVWTPSTLPKHVMSYHPEVEFDGNISEPIRSRLREIARRGLSRPLEPWPRMSKKGKILADIESDCQWTPDMGVTHHHVLWPDFWCRDAETVEPHNLWRIVVGGSLGVETVAMWRFYDPKRGRMLDIFDRPFVDAMISPSGKAAIAGGVLAEFGESESCSQQDFTGDWLGGGEYWPMRIANGIVAD